MLLDAFFNRCAIWRLGRNELFAIWHLLNSWTQNDHQQKVVSVAHRSWCVLSVNLGKCEIVNGNLQLFRTGIAGSKPVNGHARNQLLAHFIGPL